MHLNRSQSGRLQMCPQGDRSAGDQGVVVVLVDREVVQETGKKERRRRKRG